MRFMINYGEMVTRISGFSIKLTRRLMVKKPETRPVINKILY